MRVKLWVVGDGGGEAVGGGRWGGEAVGGGE